MHTVYDIGLHDDGLNFGNVADIYGNVADIFAVR